MTTWGPIQTRQRAVKPQKTVPPNAGLLPPPAARSSPGVPSCPSGLRTPATIAGPRGLQWGVPGSSRAQRFIQCGSRALPPAAIPLCYAAKAASSSPPARTQPCRRRAKAWHSGLSLLSRGQESGPCEPTGIPDAQAAGRALLARKDRETLRQTATGELHRGAVPRRFSADPGNARDGLSRARRSAEERLPGHRGRFLC